MSPAPSVSGESQTSNSYQADIAWQALAADPHAGLAKSRIGEQLCSSGRARDIPEV